jgi:predicted 3-demethylubiquinone-9 3-methyltransferase (glyoxalase superfamily)
MIRSVSPFLMFSGQAGEAMDFYVSLFCGEVVDVVRYGPGDPGPEGTIKRASFRIAGQTVMCTDSYVQHAFGFTPALSLFVDCETETELRRLAEAIAEGGRMLMPLADYGFSRLFAWADDRFGVSWQLNLD